MKEMFVEINFKNESLMMIKKINKILSEYKNLGYRLTLRQLYYQLVSQALVPNTDRSYKNVGRLVSDGRQAGLIDWKMIEDRNRETIYPSHWENPGEIVRSAANSFRVDRWKDQDVHVEVMVEKDALSGILEPICRKWDVRLTANKGYSSSSMMYEIGKRLERMENDKFEFIILYLGDHDPSGIDMTRDIEDRLKLYSGGYVDLEIDRLALNWDQIEMWRPPENPAKLTDSRYQSYMQKFGKSSWELDAIEPVTLGGLVETAITKLIDFEIWRKTEADELVMINELLEVASRWDED
jgi:hypothetical protein